jgi:hypothetical protein
MVVLREQCWAEPHVLIDARLRHFMIIRGSPKFHAAPQNVDLARQVQRLGKACLGRQGDYNSSNNNDFRNGLATQQIWRLAVGDDAGMQELEVTVCMSLMLECLAGTTGGPDP